MKRLLKFFKDNDSDICDLAELFLFLAPNGVLYDGNKIIRIILAVLCVAAYYSQMYNHPVATVIFIGIMWVITLSCLASEGGFFVIMLVFFVFSSGYWLISKDGFSKMMDDWKKGRK